jgi:CHAT domain-containing protein
LWDSEPELREVASVVGAAEEDLFIGRRATEAALKTADLAAYRVVYFATHGQIANKFGESEPSLALTVPDEPTDLDDGLLTASEITQLKLDAEWVVLSACDTASGESGNAEGLSGLARAFFHAGARALLVSNWSLDDLSAREIMKATFLALQTGHVSTKSQALQRAMIAQIDGAGSGERQWDAYPGRWAAFELVGAD